MRASADSDKYMLRLPDGMRDAIASRAEASGRSMNTEIIAAIEQYLSTDSLANRVADLSDRISKLEQLNRERKPRP